jgi:hypothetical protein
VKVKRLANYFKEGVSVVTFSKSLDFKLLSIRFIASEQVSLVENFCICILFCCINIYVRRAEINSLGLG